MCLLCQEATLTVTFSCGIVLVSDVGGLSDLQQQQQLGA